MFSFDDSDTSDSNSREQLWKPVYQQYIQRNSKFLIGTKFVAFPPDDVIKLQNHLHDIFVNNVF
jgi:hypothetical protein